MLRDKVFAANASSPPVTINTAWAWGDGGAGRLGDNSLVDKSSPVSVIGGYTDWCQVAAGCSHSLGVRQDGTAWAWGVGSCGRLGNNCTSNRSSPVSVVGGFTDWCQISAGQEQSLAVRQNGTAWAWGGNDQGQLGNNTAGLLGKRSSPVSVVGGFTDWCQVSVLNEHSLGVRTEGTAWAWGRNVSGELGDNTTVNKSSPVSVIGGFTDWCQVAAGSRFSLGLRTNGTAWGWGCNNAGVVGDNTTVNRSSPVSVVGGFTNWCQISAGDNLSLAVRQDGTAWAWGSGSSGRLGNNCTTTRASPVSVVGGFTDWCQVSAGTNSFSLAVRQNGTAWAWGDGAAGKLGNNCTTDRSSPVSVIGGYTDWCQVAAGLEHSLAIRCTV